MMKYLLLLLKGVAMGAADVIPGVSGGTIAFITGIYRQLIDSIKSINGVALRLICSGKVKEFWNYINGTFLVVLISGIAFSILTLSKLMLYLLANYEVLVWATFFGLVSASAVVVARKIKKWTIGKVLSGILCAIIAFFITKISPAETTESNLFIFLCGAIVIVAMILPGISGSFILLLMGKYYFMMSALHTFNIPVVSIFLLGAIVGIISFSHLLSWLLKRYFEYTIVALAGFMIGSLNKIWPWKNVVKSYVSQGGEIRPLITENILPNTQLLPAVLLCFTGVLVVICIEYFSSKHTTAN